MSHPATTPRPARKKTLKTLLSPRQIALVGASPDKQSVGYALFRNLVDHFSGTLYPVHPSAREIDGKPVYHSIAGIPAPVDMAVIAIPAQAVPAVLEDCGRAGTKAIVLISAGFREMGAEGAILESRIREIAQRYEMTLIGPNCLGVINTDEDIRLNATFAKSLPKKGNIAFVSQSGAIGIQALEFAVYHDIGFSKFLTIGNKAVMDESDVILALADDAETKVIMLYLESVENPEHFRQSIAAAKTGKHPKEVIVLKSGGTEAGQRAALSHTGALASPREVLSTFFAEAGVMQAETTEMLFSCAQCLANQPLPPGKRLAVVTNAGGPGIMAADAAAGLGLELPQPTARLQKILRKHLPAFAGFQNPIDILGDATEKRYAQVLETVIDSGEFDMILVVCTPQFMTPRPGVAEEVARLSHLARQRGITLITSFAVSSDQASVMQYLDAADIPNYEFVETGMKVLSACVEHTNVIPGREEQPQSYPADTQGARQWVTQCMAEGKDHLTETESYRLLNAYGFPLAPAVLAKDLDQAREAVKQTGYPVVAKIISPGIIHKYEFKAVITGIGSDGALAEAFGTLLKRAAAAGASLDGILIQQQVQGGREVIIGAKHQGRFGHVMMFGMGGTLVELFGDVSFALLPVTIHKAKKMIASVKGSALLRGFRGSNALFAEGVEQLLLRTSQLLAENPEIGELDINPVFVLQNKVVVADARVIFRKAEDVSVKDGLSKSC